MKQDDKNWPAWRYGPGGKAAVFESEKDIPKGWADHPSKVAGSSNQDAFAKFDHNKDGRPGGRPATRAARQPANTTVTAKEAAKTTGEKAIGTPPAEAAKTDPIGNQVGNAPDAGETQVELDAHGHAYDPALHAATKSKTKAGLWRMKVGVSRQDPAPGYPLDL
jgi:hypothetical protein